MEAKFERGRDDVAVVISQGTSSGLKRLSAAPDKRCTAFRTTDFVLSRPKKGYKLFNEIHDLLAGRVVSI